MKRQLSLLFAAALLATSAAHAGPTITNTVNANTLANTIAGSGITVSNATLTYAGVTLAESPTATFTGGTPSVGFDSGIVLTNGTTACATGTNTSGSCGLSRGGSSGGGIFDKTTLAFDFTSTTGAVFFQYVFASEEYNEFVGSSFNDGFELLLNGVNIALLPGNTPVSINNVNCTSNAAFFRNNSTASAGCPSLGLSIEYDGLTTILTASGAVGAGVNNFAFSIFDRADGILDSGVFIKAGSFSGTNNETPEPGTVALAGLALAAMTLASRRRRS